MGVSVEVQGLKEINQMFNKLPKQVNKSLIWGRFWKKVSDPLKQAAISHAPIADRDVIYPPDSSLKIKKGTLKNSIQFYRTRASKEANGGYVGPRVKGKFKKNKGGYFGAWVEYGHITRGGGRTTAKPWMEKAFKEKSGTVLQNGFKDATDIFVKAVKRHENRLKKYGSLGY